MTILAFGTSLADFDLHYDPPDTNMILDENSGRLSPYVVEGIEFPSGPDSFLPMTIPSQTDFWMSWYTHGVRHNESNHIVFYNALEPVFRYGNGVVQKYDGSSWTTILTQNDVLPISTTLRVDLHIKISATVGEVAVYVNGLLDEEQINIDTLYPGFGTIDNIKITGSSNTLLYDSTLSAMLVADSVTLGIKYIQAAITGAGALSDFTGAYTDIDDAGINDAQKMIATAAAESTFTTGSIPAEFDLGYVVEGVGVSVRALAGASSPNAAKLLVRSASVNGESTSFTLDDEHQNIQAVFETNPDTSAAWTVSEAENVEIGLKVS